MLFQHFVAEYRKLPRNAAVLCVGQTRREANLIYRWEKQSLSYRYLGDFVLIIPNRRGATWREGIGPFIMKTWTKTFREEFSEEKFMISSGTRRTRLGFVSLI